MKKFWTIFLTVISAVCLVGGLVACGGDKTEYTVSVLSVGGDTIANVSVKVFSESEEPVAEGVTDRSGKYSVRLKDGDYSVFISDLPKGYSTEVKSAKMTAKEPSAEFRLISSVIDGEVPANYVYSEGDVMYDFTLTTTTGSEFTLSEVLETKKAALINFWASWCGPCQSEFPSMLDAYNAAYPSEENPDRKYSDEVAIIAVSIDSNDTNAVIEEYKRKNSLTVGAFDWACNPALYTHFANKGSVPVSVIIDRYGVFSFLHVGSMTSVSDFTRLFDKYCSPNYSQSITRPGDGDDEIERPLNPYSPSETPSSNTIASAINGDGFNGSYHFEQDTGDKDYSWPWFVEEKDGEKYLYNSNKGVQQYSFATVYLKYTAKKGEVLAFDYYADIENGYDVLYVMFNEKNQFSTLTGKTDEWKTCFLDVAKEDGEYEVVFLYVADERNPDNSLTEDVVKIKNVRLTNAAEMEAQDAFLDVLFDCTSGFDEDRRVWTKYENVGFNEKDGYYHLLDAAGQPNGELIYLSTMTGTHWSNKTMYEYASENRLNFTGKNYNDFITNYCSYAAYSEYATYVPVTKELKEALDEITFQLGSARGDEDRRSDNEWLETCVYFVRYGAGETPKNPLAGMAPFAAYDLHVTDKTYDDATYTQGIQNGDLNKIEIRKQPLPRGTYFKFTPDSNGIYELRSFGDYATICWVIENEVTSYLGKDAYSILNDETYYEKNFTEYVPLEAGREYYILLDLYDQVDPTVFEEGNPGVLATYYLSIRNVGNSYSVLSRAAVPNAYTTDGSGDDETLSGDIIPILMADSFGTSKGQPVLTYRGTDSDIFVDLLTPNTITADNYNYGEYESGRMVSLKDVFNGEEKEIQVPVYDEDGKPVIGSDGKQEKKTVTYTYLKVRKYDADGYPVNNGEEPVWEEIKYEGEELEYLRGLIAEAENNHGTAENGEPPYGMVKVDAKLMRILIELTHRCSDWRASQSADGVTPNYVENEWLQMCYYYKTYKI